MTDVLVRNVAWRKAYRNRSILKNAYAAWLVRKLFPAPTQTVDQLWKELTGEVLIHCQTTCYPKIDNAHRKIH